MTNETEPGNATDFSSFYGTPPPLPLMKGKEDMPTYAAPAQTPWGLIAVGAVIVAIALMLAIRRFRR